MAEKVARSGRGSKELRLLDGEHAFVGVDVHKRTYTVTVWTPVRGVVASWTQPAEEALLLARLAAIRSGVGGVAYEAGPTGFGLCRRLRTAGFAADVVAPSRTPSSSGRRTKCDRRDSEQLAFLLGKEMLTPVYVPTPKEEADRQLVRRRDQVMGWVRRVKSQIKSLLLQHGIEEPAGLAYWSRASVQALRDLSLGPAMRQVVDSLLDELASAAAQRDRLSRQVSDLAATPRHAAAAALLRHVPGVGLVTAMTFLTELPRPERFGRPTQLGSYLGLAPLVRQSGETEHRGPIMKAGNRRLRTILIEAAWQWIRYDPAARTRYDHLKQNTKSGYKAITGVARRLGILLWHLVSTGEVYEPPPTDPAPDGDTP